jgi:UDP-N-acetylmuramate--alanine ligase
MGVDFNNIKRVYFLGIGGIGMSALARYFKATGKDVAGYDRTQAPLTKELISSGINIHFSDETGLIPADYLNKEDTLVVVTPAIPGNHKELAYFRNNSFMLFKRSEILGFIAGQKYNIAVSGTHGKTTVSTMIAHIMSQSESGCSAFLGGISKNFKSNLVYNAKSNYIITEADEFDRSFLRLHPQLTVITAMDADHLDIYGSRDELVRTFSQFANQTRKGGIILAKKGLKLDLDYDYNNYTYTLAEKADFYASNITLNRGIYSFEVVTPSSVIKNMSLRHPGIVNVENAIAATAVTYLTGIDAEIIRNALSTFNGISRRFDIILKTEELIYIDDYAHHPRELSAVINSVRKLYPGKKVTGIFQPHLYSRTRDFAGEFAESLDTLDDLILLDIYPARELPIKNITSKIIFDKVKLSGKMLCSKNDLPGILKNMKLEVLLTMGAGDIDQLVEPIKTMLDEKLKKGGK